MARTLPVCIHTRALSNRDIRLITSFSACGGASITTPHQVSVQLFKSGELCDVKLRSNTESVSHNVHRFLLTQCSEYFKVILDDTVVCHSENYVIGLDVDGPTLDSIVDYVYHQNTAINSGNFIDILIAADMYLLNGLLTRCWNFVSDNLSPSTFIQACNLVEYLFCSEEVRQKIWNYTLLELVTCMYERPGELQQLHINALKRLLSSDDLRIRNETEVIDVITTWSEDQPLKSVDESVAQLIQLVRATPDTTKTIKTLKRTTFQNYPLTLQVLANFGKMACPIPRIPVDSLFVLGGYTEFVASATMEVFDYNADAWYGTTSQFPEPLALFGAVAYRHCIYIIGGSNYRYDVCDEVRRFDTISSRWSIPCRLRDARSNHSVVLLDDTIYVIGGKTSTKEYTSSVECYYPGRSQTFHYTSHLMVARSFASACIFRHQIFVAGGLTRNGVADTVEYFDPTTKQWTMFHKLPVTVRNHRLVSDGEFMYVVGGLMNGSVSNRAFLADQFGTDWIETSGMPVARRNFAAVFFNKKIFIMGGTEGSVPLRSVVSLDCNTLQWKQESDLRLARVSCECVFFENFFMRELYSCCTLMRKRDDVQILPQDTVLEESPILRAIQQQ